MNIVKRKSAIILSVVFVCLILLTSCLIVAQHGHDCIGENCVICSVVDAAQKLLDGLMVGAISSILFAVFIKFNFSNVLLFVKKSLFSTLISLKVKLSN